MGRITVLYKVRARLEIEGGMDWCDGARTGAVAEARSWCTTGKAKPQGRLCTWRVCVGSGGTKGLEERVIEGGQATSGPGKPPSCI